MIRPYSFDKSVRKSDSGRTALNELSRGICWLGDTRPHILVRGSEVRPSGTAQWRKELEINTSGDEVVLYTVADSGRALAEVRRVLKPQGQLLLIEHVRSDDSKLACWQDRLRRPWAWVGHGCQCNRPTVESIRGRAPKVTLLQDAAVRRKGDWA